MGQIVTTVRPRLVEFSAKVGDEVCYATYDRAKNYLSCRNFETGVTQDYFNVEDSDQAMTFFSGFLTAFCCN